MNKHSKGNIHLKPLRGATYKDMLHFVQATLDRAISDGIINVATNSVSAKRKRPSDIADSIISVGKKCQATGVTNVMIFSSGRREVLGFRQK